MKHKITRKLILYFSITLILFALITSGLFVYTFTKQSMDKRIEDLKVQANEIAQTLTSTQQSKRITTQRKHSSNNHGESEISNAQYADDISLLEAAMQGNIWVIDKNTDVVHVGHGGHRVNYNDFPSEANDVIDDAFDGKTKSSKSFSSLMEAPTISVAAPILNNSDQVVAVVLLHTELASIESAIKDGTSIFFISLAISLLFVFVLALLLARKFVVPLKKMEKVTKTLTQGNYSARSAIHQKDEIGSLAFHIDMLAEKLAENEKTLSQIEQSRKDFMTKIAHELRTPVTVLRGSLEALKDGIVTDPEKIQDYYQQMLADSLHLERMINDLLELARLQNPDYAIHKEKINIIAVLHDALRSIRPLTNNKSIKIEYLHKNIVHQMHGDYARLRQMFLIVLDNAIKFSPDHSRIHIEVEHTNKELNISVRDEGCGIDASQLKNIYNKFYSTATNQSSSASGLGLSIAKEIAERHDIRLVIENNVSKGVIVEFFIPFQS
ncbi:MAG: ATP-binding protein [Breznakia sp.]